MALMIQSIATALPQVAERQERLAAMVESITCRTAAQRKQLPRLYRRSGVRRRGSVLLEQGATGMIGHAGFYDRGEGEHGPTTATRMQRYRDEASPLAARACVDALRRAHTDPRQITHVVSVSCTGFAAPGIDIELIDALGLLPTVERTHIGFMGCHGGLNGLRVASAIATAEPKSHVLVCCVELCTLHLGCAWDTSRIVAEALFADGAAAAIGCSEEAPGRDRDGWRVIANGSNLIPDSRDAMTWTIGDQGFVMTLSPRVPDLIAAHLRPWLDEWLGDRGLTVESVGSWAVHPGGPRVLATVEQTLDLCPDALLESHAVLAECGNMSSATVLFIIDRLQRHPDRRPCVVLGFGPGLTVEVMLLA